MLGPPQNLPTLHRSRSTGIAASALALIQEEEKQKAALAEKPKKE
jgi:hypothetical protein